MKKSHLFFILSLIITIILSLFFAYGCNASSTIPATDNETAAQTPPPTVTSETNNANEDMHTETIEEEPEEMALETPVAPLSDISCILGYWEVETGSLLDAANSLVSANSITIFTRVEPHIIYAFYEGDFGVDTTQYRMDIWYDDVLVTANVMGEGEEPDKTIDMHLNGILTAEIISEREGQLVYRPIESENNLEITEMWLDGSLISDGPMDISDMADTNVAREFIFECLGNGRLMLAYQEGVIYLNATTRTSG